MQKCDTIWKVAKRHVSRPCFARYLQDPSDEVRISFDHETKLSGFSLNRCSRLVNASTRSAFWTSDNIHGTHCADTLGLFIHNVYTNRDTNRCTDETNWQSSISHDEIFAFFNSFFVERICQSSSCKFSMWLCNCSITKSRLANILEKWCPARNCGVSPEGGKRSLPWKGFVEHVGFEPEVKK